MKLFKFSSFAPKQQSISDDDKNTLSSLPLLNSREIKSKHATTSKRNFNLQNVMESLICVTINRKIETDDIVYTDTSYSSSSVGSGHEARDCLSSPEGEDSLSKHGVVLVFPGCFHGTVSGKNEVARSPNFETTWDKDSFSKTVATTSPLKQYSSPRHHCFSEDFVTQWILAGNNTEDHHPEVEVVASSTLQPIRKLIETQIGSCLPILAASNEHRDSTTTTKIATETPIVKQPDFPKRSICDNLARNAGIAHQGFTRLLPSCDEQDYLTTNKATVTIKSNHSSSSSVINKKCLPDVHLNNIISKDDSKRDNQQPNGNFPSYGTSIKKKKAIRARMSNAEAAAEAQYWREAIDPKSGRPYWYHTTTRETQWAQPLCCASPEEREDAYKKQQQTRDFFAAMEMNILKHMSNGRVGEEEVARIDNVSTDDVFKKVNRDHRPPCTLERPSPLVRTISTMEASVLADLVGRVPSHRQLKPKTRHPHDTTLGTDASHATGKTFHRPREMNVTAKQMFLSANDQVGAGHKQSRTHTTVMNLVVEEQNEDTSNNSLNIETQQYDGVDVNVIASSIDKEDDEVVHRGISKMSGTLRLTTFLDDVDNYHDPLIHESNNINHEPSALPRMSCLMKEDSMSLSMLGNLSDESHKNLTLTATSSSNGNDEEMHVNFDEWNNRAVRLDDSACWSLLTQSKELGVGLSSDERDSMEELAAITQKMVDVDIMLASNTWDPHSLEDNLDILAPSKYAEGYELPTPKMKLEFSDDEQLLDITRPMPNSEGRPQIANAVSLRIESVALTEVKKPTLMQRRNTCGTLYVGTTMAAPDKDATIKCVCGVYRAHILQSQLDDDMLDEKYPIFNDMEHLRDPKADAQSTPLPLLPPTLNEITSFYRDVFIRAKMETDCIIMSLIYVERLIKDTQGFLRPNTANWRSILFSCMVLASKVWDDLSMWNADFSQTSPAGVEFTLQRVNELELAILSALKYKVKVPASEYAKYYFLLRSMLIKSGLGSDDLSTMNPLDVEGARQLQHVSSRYEASATLSNIQKAPMTTRSKTVGTKSPDELSSSELSNEVKPMPPTGLETKNKVGLEHLVQM